MGFQCLPALIPTTKTIARYHHLHDSFYVNVNRTHPVAGVRSTTEDLPYRTTTAIAASPSRISTATPPKWTTEAAETDNEVPHTVGVPPPPLTDFSPIPNSRPSYDLTKDGSPQRETP